MNFPDDIELMLYADGELDDEGQARVGAALASSSVLRAKLEALGQLGETVQGYLEIEGDVHEHKLDGLWDRVASNIGQAARAPEPSTVSGAADHGPGFLAVIREFFQGFGGSVTMGLVGAAAAVLVMVLIQSEGGGEPAVAVRAPAVAPPAVRPPVVGPSASGHGTAGVQPIRAVLAAQPIEVESLEVYNGSGTILTVPGDDEGSTTVIWLSPDSDVVEGPI